ncbi:MAG: HAMP domain-containing histidine kinase [Nannocystis sp.]|nr:HAMP domain-containing histidine kinase [Nannocystis sp.]
MRPHLLLALVALVLGPLLLLGALALKVLRDEESLVRHDLRELMEQRLDDSRAPIREMIGAIELELIRDLDACAGDADALRALQRGRPLIRQIFLADPEGRRLHPPPDDQASRDERDFVERTRAIWQASAELVHAGPAELSQTQPQTQPQTQEQTQEQTQAQTQPQTQAKDRAPAQERDLPAADSLAGLARARDQGWIPWYWEEGLHLIFWRRRPDGLVAGIELERAALLQRLIAALPATDGQNTLILIADARGDPIYTWGEFELASLKEPAGEHDRPAPLARLPLPPPLEAWSIQYFSQQSDAPVNLGASRLLLAIGLTAAALVLLGLAAFFYREWTRSMRDARQRVTFVTQVSHELKTPLTNIRLYAELLADELSGVDERAEAHAAVIVSESQRLSRLIANVLTFSRGDRPLASRARPLHLGPLLDAAVDHFAPAYAERGIEVHRAGSAPLPVLADDDAIGQILANLLSNVEKYAAAGKHAALELEQDPKHTRLRVRDRGPGVAARHRRRIFDPFFRARSDLHEGVSGTGIGLTIARQLARASGGELELLASDRGACFQLTLPTAPTAPAALAASTPA